MKSDLNKTGPNALHVPESRLDLKLYPEPLLRQTCEPVEMFDSELQEIVKQMFILMHKHGGIGLAAPQAGLKKRLFVCEVDGRSLCIANPQIKNRNGMVERIEGCLSLPGVSIVVPRNQGFIVEGYDEKGCAVKYMMTDLWARVTQHETDHLNGRLIVDYKNYETDISPL